MVERFVKETQFFTTVLPYKDFTVLDPEQTGKPEPVYRAPSDARVLVRGEAIGSAGEFAFIAANQAAFGPRPPTGTQFPFFGQALTVPTGAKFKFRLAPDQTLYALGTIEADLSDGVWLTFSVELFPLYMVDDDVLGGEAGSGGGRVAGPPWNWRKRGGE